MRRIALAIALAVGLVAGGRSVAARPLPVTVEGGTVRVVAEDGLESTARRLHAASAPVLARIADDLPGLRVPIGIEVRVVADAAAMQDVAPPGAIVPAWASGVAFPDAGVIVVALTSRGHPLDVDHTLRHELAHLALGAALGDNAPRWLHEGFAYQHSSEWTWDRTETLAGMAWGSVIPLDELEQRFPAEELPASRAYAESYDFVGFLAHRGRWDDASDDGDRWPFRQFLRFLAAGASPDDAATKAFGRPLRELFEEWRQDLRKRFVWIPAGLFGLLLWIVAAVLLMLAFLRRRRQNRRRLAEWEREEAEADARRAAWLATLGIDPDPDDHPAPTPAELN